MKTIFGDRFSARFREHDSSGAVEANLERRLRQHEYAGEPVLLSMCKAASSGGWTHVTTGRCF
jgi:hypothetical protein